ncbi:MULTISPECIES: helix-turn-helix domain-containing protein [Enterococcus]|uniref:helix-turn-helix domain-containing protein n=1 Tax=Enterococcus TaxID=1350 RepID=UPI000B675F06|nr:MULTISPECIES: helix-turn-helix transcriptional regulator [Enterococcus]OTO15158.1 hypothetical protein A5875_004315 [Enterococcus sp. 3H8_DIV0648]
MNPYEKIKELTKQNGISVRELEKRLGYSNGYFSKWKNVSPNSDGLAKVADYFGISIDYLLGRKSNTADEGKNEAAVQLGGLFRSVAKKEELNDQEQQELKEDLDWYMKERARLIKERQKRG